MIKVFVQADPSQSQAQGMSQIRQPGQP